MSDFPASGSSPAGDVQALRTRYNRHRDALSRLAADAPTQQLADSYNRLRMEIEVSLTKLEGLDSGASAAVSTATASVPFLDRTPPVAASAPPHPARIGAETSPYSSPFDGSYEPLPDTTGNPGGTRVIVVALIGILVLALLGYFIWRYSAARNPTARIIEETATTTSGTEAISDTSATAAETSASETAAPVTSVADTLIVTPPSFDYGVVRKGTRKTQKFSLQNNSATALAIRIGRSQCRCLWFEHPVAVAAHGKASLTVTVDGGRAKPGQLSETIELQAKDKSPAGRLNVTATVK